MPALAPERRRQLVCLAAAIVGTVLLGLSLGSEPGDGRFYPLTLALAATWAGGAFLSGPLHVGHGPAWDRRHAIRPVLPGIVTGALLAAVFAVGALIVSPIGLARTAISDVIAHAQQGSYPVVVALALLTGLTEELFFRGALYAALDRWRPVETTTVAYAVVTLATGNVLLVLASAMLGYVTARQRRTTGGVLAPILTHVTWSLGMILILPYVLELTS